MTTLPGSTAVLGMKFKHTEGQQFPTARLLVSPRVTRHSIKQHKLMELDAMEYDDERGTLGDDSYPAIVTVGGSWACPAWEEAGRATGWGLVSLPWSPVRTLSEYRQKGIWWVARWGRTTHPTSGA